MTVPVNDVTLVVVLSDEAKVAELAATLARLAGVRALETASLVLVHPPSARATVGEALAGHPRARAVEAASELRGALDEAAIDHASALETRFVAFASLAAGTDLDALAAQIQKQRERLDPLGLHLDLPLLAWTDTCPRSTAACYVARALAVVRGELAQDVADYLGGITLFSARLLLESVDPRDGEIELSAWCDARSRPADVPPPWRFRVVLSGPEGQRIESDAIRPSPRVEEDGTVHHENLVARLSLTTADTGDHRLFVELVTDTPQLRLRRNLRPRPGVLLGSRTVQMAPRVRYLVHATSPMTTTLLAVMRGTGPWSALRWNLMLVRKDLAYALRGSGGRRTRLLRLLRLLTLPFFAGREIWLLGERPDTAQDNGLHLFEHLRREHPRRSVYYLIDWDSPQRERVERFGNVVRHSSLRHRLLMLHADVLANAYSIKHMTPRQWDETNHARHIAWRVGSLRVYLKHGVHLSPNAFKRGGSGYDVCLTVTGAETAALRAVSGYDEQLVEVGLPRYDALVPAPESRTILFMSTWRRYLVPRIFGGRRQDQDPYVGSAYAQFMSAFLQSGRLQELLEQYDYRLKFLPHYNMAEHFDTVATAGDRVLLADPDEGSFQDLLRECDAFVTDHSSVHFDVAYLGTPIIYARFDREEYERRHASPSWFDYERDGFGPVTYTLDETLDALEALLERGCTQDPRYAERIEAAFTFRDQGNCERATAAIDAKLAETRRRR